MGLLVVPVLQAVFEAAQEAVGFEQPGGRFGRKNAGLGQCGQRFLRTFELEAAVLPAADHLEHLRDKFHLANAARTELDVAGHAFFAHFAADLAVQPAQGFVGAVVQIFAEHERLHHAADAVGIRRNHAAFAPSITLPFAPLRHQILLQRGFAQHQRAAVAVGAQAHIDAEHLAVGGDVVQQRNQLLPHLGEKLLIAAAAPPVGFVRFGIDENQIQIRRHV